MNEDQNEMKEDQHQSWKRQKKYNKKLDCFVGSNIVSPYQSDFLKELIKQSEDIEENQVQDQFKLVYRGSENAFKGSKKILEKYKNKLPVLILIESDLEQSFGSYEFKAKQFGKDIDSFIFQLDHETIHTLKDAKQINVTSHSDDDGYFFGRGAFSIFGQDEVRRGSSYLENFSSPDIDQTIEKLKLSKDDYLAGYKYFKIQEIEIYAAVNEENQEDNE